MPSFLEFCLQKVADKHGIDLQGINMSQLKMGMSVEQEYDTKNHVPWRDEGVVMKIIVTNLRENTDYYKGEMP